MSKDVVIAANCNIVLKYFSSFAAVKIGKKKSVHHHLLTNVGAHFFFANFYCSER